MMISALLISFSISAGLINLAFFSIPRLLFSSTFLKKYSAIGLENKSLGIEKNAKFIKPAEMENEINSADIIISDYDPNPEAQGDDQGVGTQDDYNEYGPADPIGPESKPVEDDPKPKKDTQKVIQNNPANKKDDDAVPIGTPADKPEKKKGLLRRLFDKKNN